MSPIRTTILSALCSILTFPSAPATANQDKASQSVAPVLSKSGGTKSPAVRLYRLDFDVTRYTVENFVDLGDDNIGLESLDAATGVERIDDFLHGQELKFGPNAPSFEQVHPRAAKLGWGTWAWVTGFPFPSINLDGTTLTFITDRDSIRFHGDYFYDECTDPASNYIRVEGDGRLEEKVLFYVFSEPISLVVNDRCEETLYAPPHDKIRIVDPFLIAVRTKNGAVLLAGQGYVAMPVVLSLPAAASLAGDGKSIFVMDKKIVDGIRQSVADEYNSRQKTGHLPDKNIEAQIAAEIEERLLKYISHGG